MRTLIGSSTRNAKPCSRASDEDCRRYQRLRERGLLKTSATEQEVFEVLQRPHSAEDTPPLFADRLRRIFAAAELVTIAERVTACRDSKDDKFLELAANGRADVIISGAAALLVLNPFRDIPIPAPAASGRAQIP